MSTGSMDRRINEPRTTGRSSSTNEEENKNLVRRSLEEIWGKYDVNAIDKYYAANFVDHTPMAGTPPNREGIKKAVSLYGKAFPNSHLTVEEVIAQGDKVAARFSFHGKQTGELQGIAPTGRDVKLLGLTICRVENGKVVESWESVDQLQMLQQIGAVQLPPIEKR